MIALSCHCHFQSKGNCPKKGEDLVIWNCWGPKDVVVSVSVRLMAWIQEEAKDPWICRSCGDVIAMSYRGAFLLDNHLRTFAPALKHKGLAPTCSHYTAGLPCPHFTWTSPCTTHRLSLFDKNLQAFLYGTFVKMSSSPKDSPKRATSPMRAVSPDRAASLEREISPKRAPIKINANGVISETQDERWPGHPANALYKGSDDSENNSTDVNEPDRLSLKGLPKDSRDKTTVTTTATVTPNTEPRESRGRRPSISLYPGTGPHGIPLEGKDGGWKDHPSHMLYQTQGINHNGINIPDATEAFILGDNEKKIEEKIDTRTPNTVIFTFNKEDHTLANLLREKLLKNSHVTFAAYRVPHPLFAKFELRVQTDGEITPKEAIVASAGDTISELSRLKTNFTREYELRKMVGNAQNTQ
ncbi:uncharacterized protein A1O9_10247 [Exophiala aquamarina CBS 119918]|uniref:DNA-directed RNA polymerase RBP11-like dimerisation domain-containing protein n=1 Tax=Exophiala aquamarina CBS 119918 TaxID=1182545 RepID=A0A072PE77_9EURO|nr:uncharacterized protein A1O9_10247 [Exophiala aquamarina CBS 119918]KEF53845.1 hypothetical protein A1O9_10247 [Exophiala aquamarina CBS 119918]